MRRPLRVVLDTTAILAYTRGSIHVGEIVAEVLDEGATFGVPVACLSCAAAEAKDPGRVEILLRQPGCRIVPHTGDDWRSLALALQVLGVLGRFDLAAAMLAAVSGGDAHILTGEPQAYAPAGDAVSIVAI